MVHSFSTNSEILKGFYQALADNEIVNLIPIDLPGFHKNNPALENVDFDKLSDWLRAEITKKINKLGLDDYWLAGVSFGFRIANDAAHKMLKERDKLPSGIVAIEPYSGRESLKMSKTKETIFKVLGKVLEATGAYRVIFNRYLIENVFLKGDKAKEIADLTLKHVDPKTFGKIGNEILQQSDKSTPLDYFKYILVLNPEDTSLDSARVRNQFNAAKENLLVEFLTEIQHYPKDMSQEYFAGVMQAERLVKRFARAMRGEKYEKPKNVTVAMDALLTQQYHGVEDYLIELIGEKFPNQEIIINLNLESRTVNKLFPLHIDRVDVSKIDKSCSLTLKPEIYVDGKKLEFPDIPITSDGVMRALRELCKQSIPQIQQKIQLDSQAADAEESAAIEKQIKRN